ncbi:MAG: hypothetical protein QM751_08860 [Paludibacteraceae bacterium]
MSLERGQVLSEQVFDREKSLVKQTSFNYNDDENRFNQQVRFYRYLPNGFNNTGYKSYRLIAGVHYTYFPYLKKKTTNIGGIEQTETYSYDDNFRLLKTISTKDSKNQINVITLKYPYEDTTKEINRDMTKKFMLSYFIEKQRTTNGTSIYTQYKEYAKSLNINDSETILLNKVSSRYGNENTLNTEFICSRYDCFGNLQQKELNNGIQVTYLWSYNYQYPIAEIINATYDEVSNVMPGFFSYIERASSPSDIMLKSLGDGLRNGLPHAQVTTYTYKPLVGMTSQTDPRGVTTYYEYDGFGRLKRCYVKENGIEKKLQDYDYYYLNQ